jgi:hypothetical protein
MSQGCLSRAAVSGLGFATFSCSLKQHFQDSGDLYLKSAILALLSPVASDFGTQQEHLLFACRVLVLFCSHPSFPLLLLFYSEMEMFTLYHGVFIAFCF